MPRSSVCVGVRMLRRSASSMFIGFAFAGLSFFAASGFSLDKAWSQDRRGSRQSESEPAQPPKAAAADKAASAIDSSSPFGMSLLSCDKDEEEPGQFALPGLKGDIKLDRCYRGRRHLVCRFGAVLAEEKALTDAFTRIVEERYPDSQNVEDICKRSLESLISDAGGAAEFLKRFGASRSEYDARTGCANKIKQSFQEVTLPDLVQAPEVLKSMMDAVDQEVSRVSVVQEQVAALAQKMEVSQRAIGVLQKIHRSICMTGKNPTQAELPTASN
jgi:hypothetical protein